MRFVCALAAVGLLAGCPAREIDGNPPPHFAILDDLDRTPDPACEGHWVAGIRGRVIDARGAGVAGATVQHCLRLTDGRFVCTSPPTAADGTVQLEMTDDAGWYAYVFDPEVRCVDELTVRVLRRSMPTRYATAYCPVELDPDAAVQLLPHPAVLHPVDEPSALPPPGDEAAPRDVALPDGVTLTDVVPGALYGDYEALRGASLPTDPNHCFLRSFENLETLLGLYALAPEVESAEPIGLRLPNDADLAEGSTVTLYALGGLATLRPDGEAIPEGAFQAFGTATVVGDVLVSDPGVALPATSVIGWGR
ncbi:MAG: hypothetical protein CMN30_09710 [Sandaracinus sp.]|nr:hypothetical protein [Sandaracinus sp.]MAQ15055.1 hypothetical protein [Sandaracinus sp.]